MSLKKYWTLKGPLPPIITPRARLLAPESEVPEAPEDALEKWERWEIGERWGGMGGGGWGGNGGKLGEEWGITTRSR